MARDLRPFFAPRSVAVVGAGARPTSSGGAILQNLRISRYGGVVHPINPKGGTLFDLPVAASLSELAAPADLVVVVIRPDAIPDVVREAARTGHRNLLILPGGFAEAGEPGRARDREVRALAAEHGITIAGPNCAGIIHGIVQGSGSSRFAATFLRDMPRGAAPGEAAIAFVTQSGAIAEEMIAASHRMALPVATLVSVGNAMHLGVEDYLDHLGRDETIGAVLLYIEAIEDPARFRSVARTVAATKPVVALFGGRTDPGARAAAAHTGAIANSDAAIDGFLAECGIVRVDSLRRLLLAAKGFGRFPRGFGKRVLVLSNSGGPGVVCADRAAAEGLELPALPDAMAARLREMLPPEASVANPIDLLADAREDRFEPTLELAFAAKDAFDAILMIHVVPFMVDAAPVIRALARVAEAAPLPVMHSMMGTLEGKAEWFAAMEAAGVPMFDDVEAMAECAAQVARYPALRERARSTNAGPLGFKGRGA
ncbi:MAG TPA: CoA-binding protein [Candidatus Sulfotelmatobacter sp.]|nr:CoA-binding protein [Candidatus Sulfotelmatobacter sp.]